MAEMEVQSWPVDKLVEYARNARQHPPENIAKLAASIAEFGWTTPLLITSTGHIVAGHGRVAAARALGMAEVPCVVVGDDWSEAKRRAYIIADNRLTLDSSWDLAMLRLELQDLDTGEFDLSLTGFDDDELADLLTFDPEPQNSDTDPDESPEPRAEAISKPGDIWILGNHRLACGDCRDAHVVEALLGDEKPHLMVTDQPYGVEYDADWRNKALREDGSPIGGRATGVVKNDDKTDWRDAWALFPGDVAYVWHAGIYGRDAQESLEACDFEIRAQIIWAKSNLVIGRGHYHWQHEPALMAVRKGATAHWNGDRKQTTLWRFVDDLIEPGEEVYIRKSDADVIYAISGHESTVWEIPKPNKSETGHSTQKPVECMRRPMVNNSKVGDAIYEPFAGSGTSLIAGEMTGRRVFAIELSPNYVDVCIRRWEQFTGQKAVLESTGEFFPG